MLALLDAVEAAVLQSLRSWRLVADLLLVVLPRKRHCSCHFDLRRSGGAAGSGSGRSKSRRRLASYVVREVHGGGAALGLGSLEGEVVLEEGVVELLDCAVNGEFVALAGERCPVPNEGTVKWVLLLSLIVDVDGDLGRLELLRGVETEVACVQKDRELASLFLRILSVGQRAYVRVKDGLRPRVVALVVTVEDGGASDDDHIERVAVYTDAVRAVHYLVDRYAPGVLRRGCVLFSEEGANAHFPALLDVGDADVVEAQRLEQVAAAVDLLVELL